MEPVPTEKTASTSRPLAQNRRRGNRHALHIPATLVRDGHPAEPLAVTIVEISVAGVGLRVKQSLTLGDICTLSSYDTLVPPGMTVRIVSQQPVGHGEFRVGAQTV
jgi:hypothetical protein